MGKNEWTASGDTGLGFDASRNLVFVYCILGDYRFEQ